MKTKRFHRLQALMNQAFQNEDFNEAKTLALEYLALASSFKSNWNYGNAIHHANIILGRISLIEGKIERSKTYLISAGQTIGSPQLKSFGPNMSLAKELLEIGEKNVVIEYLDLCKEFWYKIFSWYKIRKWKKIIRKGGIPDFKANLIY